MLVETLSQKTGKYCSTNVAEGKKSCQLRPRTQAAVPSCRMNPGVAAVVLVFFSIRSSDRDAFFHRPLGYHAPEVGRSRRCEKHDLSSTEIKNAAKKGKVFRSG